MSRQNEYLQKHKDLKCTFYKKHSPLVIEYINTEHKVSIIGEIQHNTIIEPNDTIGYLSKALKFAKISEYGS